MAHFIQRIRGCQRRADRLSRALKRIDDQYTTQQPELESELLETSVETEKTCLELRKLLAEIGCVSKREYLSQLSNTHEIQIEERDGRMYLTLPVLPLKKKSHTSCEFTIDPLIACLKDYQKSHKCKVYETARITFCHCYPKETPAKSLRDCDNIEAKKVLDVLALYFLKDDNMACCEILHTSRPADDYKTEIIISDWGENQ